MSWALSWALSWVSVATIERGHELKIADTKEGG
jgi:hypothetical protein